MLFSKKPDESSTESHRQSSRPAAEHPTQPLRGQVGSPTQSIIDAWLTINGNLESQGDVRVEGQISGDIRCVNLVIGRDATVSGDITAEEAVVRGKVKGTIRANRVILQDTACVESAIFHKVLSVDEGATFDGQSCHRMQPHQDEEALPRVARADPEASAIEPFDRPNGGPVAGTGFHAADA
jgi:cytoskeletal protein CcmA (bactofilin family)